MHKLVAHFIDPAPLPDWESQLTTLGFVPSGDGCWRQGGFELTLQADGDLWLQGEGERLPADVVPALLELAGRLSAGGELELFEEDGRLLQRHSF